MYIVNKGNAKEYCNKLILILPQAKAKFLRLTCTILVLTIKIRCGLKFKKLEQKDCKIRAFEVKKSLCSAKV